MLEYFNFLTLILSQLKPSESYINKDSGALGKSRAHAKLLHWPGVYLEDKCGQKVTHPLGAQLYSTVCAKVHGDRAYKT